MAEYIASKEIPSIRRLSNTDPVKLKMSIVGIIENCVSKFGAKDTMTKPLIKELANDMIEDFPHWKLNDFVNFYHRAAKGEYGPVYHGIDYARLYEWASKYEDARMDELIKVNKRIPVEPVEVITEEQAKQSKELAAEILKGLPETKTDPDRKAYAQHKMNYELNRKIEVVKCGKCGKEITKTEHDLFQGCEKCK